MRKLLFGASLGAGLGIAFTLGQGYTPTAYGVDTIPLPTTSSNTMALEVIQATEKSLPKVVVLDTQKKVLATYQINPEGKIKLLNVRQIQWDLELVDFNNEKPLPKDIRNNLPK